MCKNKILIIIIFLFLISFIAKAQNKEEWKDRDKWDGDPTEIPEGYENDPEVFDKVLENPENTNKLSMQQIQSLNDENTKKLINYLKTNEKADQSKWKFLKDNQIKENFDIIDDVSKLDNDNFNSALNKKMEESGKDFSATVKTIAGNKIEIVGDKIILDNNGKRLDLTTFVSPDVISIEAVSAGEGDALTPGYKIRSRTEEKDASTVLIGDFNEIRLNDDWSFDIDGNTVIGEGGMITYIEEKDSFGDIVGKRWVATQPTIIIPKKDEAEKFGDIKYENIVEKIVLGESGIASLSYFPLDKQPETATIGNGEIYFKFKSERDGETVTQNAIVTAERGEGEKNIYLDGFGTFVELEGYDVSFESPKFWDEEWERKALLFTAKGYVTVETADIRYNGKNDYANIDVGWDFEQNGLKERVRKVEGLSEGDFADITYYHHFTDKEGKEIKITTTDYLRVNKKDEIVFDEDRKQLGELAKYTRDKNYEYQDYSVMNLVVTETKGDVEIVIDLEGKTVTAEAKGLEMKFTDPRKTEREVRVDGKVVAKWDEEKIAIAEAYGNVIYDEKGKIKEIIVPEMYGVMTLGKTEDGKIALSEIDIKGEAKDITVKTTNSLTEVIRGDIGFEKTEEGLKIVEKWKGKMQSPTGWFSDKIKKIPIVGPVAGFVIDVRSEIGSVITAPISFVTGEIAEKTESSTWYVITSMLKNGVMVDREKTYTIPLGTFGIRKDGTEQPTT